MIILLFLLAAYCEFLLIGYGSIALILAASGFVAMAYLCISFIKNRKTAKILSLILSASVALTAAIFSIALSAVIREAHTDPEPHADYLIIFGAGLHGETPSMSLQDRLDAALIYLIDYPNCIAVASGGQGPDESISEAEAIRSFLLHSGIDDSRIVIENKSTSTYENLLFSTQIITDNGGSLNSVAALSSEYHLYRIKKFADNLAIPLKSVAAHTSNPAIMSNYFIREALGAVYIFLFGIR